MAAFHLVSQSVGCFSFGQSSWLLFVWSVVAAFRLVSFVSRGCFSFGQVAAFRLVSRGCFSVRSVVAAFSVIPVCFSFIPVCFSFSLPVCFLFIPVCFSFGQSQLLFVPVAAAFQSFQYAFRLVSHGCFSFGHSWLLFVQSGLLFVWSTVAAFHSFWSDMADFRSVSLLFIPSNLIFVQSIRG